MEQRSSDGRGTSGERPNHERGVSDVTSSSTPNPESLEREIARIELGIFKGSIEQDAADLTRLRPLIESAGDDALLGRALVLLTRVTVAMGRHEAAAVLGEAGIRAFERLDPARARRYAGHHAEMLRAAAAAQAKLGNTAAALPQLEQAVRIAQGAVDESPDSVQPDFDAGVCSPLSALIRGLVTLGVTLFAIREIDTAIAMYYRAIATADRRPTAYERFPDDMMLVMWNLTDALHERATRRRAAGKLDLAAEDIAAAAHVLDPQNWRIADDVAGSDCVGPPFLRRLSSSAREGYFASMGRHLLITGQPAQARSMFERQSLEIKSKAFVDDWGLADAAAGIAQAALELGDAQDALAHCEAALDALERHDESNTRATVLLVQANAHRALGQYDAAIVALDAHHQLRDRLEAVAAQQYAAHMTLQLGLERARADAESHRRIAATLETMSRVGQEITANLDTEAVFAILGRHVVTLLHAPTFVVWLLDETGGTLVMGFGVEDGRPISVPDIELEHPLSFAARAVRERREIICYSSTQRGDGLALPGTRPMEFALFAPLIVGDRVFGVVSIQSDRADGYSENERSIFRTLCAYGAIGLDNAAAYRKLAGTIVQLRSTQAELALRTAEFERLSMTDPLTGVANRRYLHDRANVEIAEVKRKDGRLSVAMFDIDHFKLVNDTYGHAVGDAVLQNVAHVAKQWLRPVDLIARMGGEEFALLLPGAGIREAVDIAERIRHGIAETSISAGATTVRVTSSFGVAEFDASIDVLDHALRHADAALYAAKSAGRNRVRCAS